MYMAALRRMKGREGSADAPDLAERLTEAEDRGRRKEQAPEELLEVRRLCPVGGCAMSQVGHNDHDICVQVFRGLA
jgi:hypothetical protein